MIMVRAVLSCKPGKVRPAVQKFQALNKWMEQKGLSPYRIFTDVAGAEFWTMVLEREFESLDAAQSWEMEMLADPQAKELMAGYHDLVRAGRREFYTVEG